MRAPTWGGPLGLLLLVTACGGDGPTGPDEAAEPAVRRVLFHRQDTGENRLLNSDGTGAATVTVPGALNVPIAVAPRERLMAVVHGNVLALVELETPGRVDTIIAPLPQLLSLASFSNDGRYVAIVSYQPVRAVLVYDRTNRTVDTLPYGDRDAVLPPVFSPDNERIAVITESRLSLFSTVLVRREPGRFTTETFGFSRFLTIPVFGWPRWTDEGLLMAFVREGGQAPDTLLAARIDPVAPSDFVDEQFRAVLSPVSDERPEIVFGPISTYAFSADGRAIVLGADPGTGGPGRHALYVITPRVGRIQLVLDDPAQFPILPNFVN